MDPTVLVYKAPISVNDYQYLLSTLIVGERRPTIRVHQSLPLRIRSGLSIHDNNDITVLVYNKIFKFCLLKTVI